MSDIFLLQMCLQKLIGLMLGMVRLGKVSFIRFGYIISAVLNLGYRTPRGT
jgi:hypothetical protein